MVCTIFCDDSGHSGQRYRSIGVVALPKTETDGLRAELRKCLQRAGVNHVEWKEIQGDSRYQNAGMDFIRHGIFWAAQNKIHITVLMWDLEDSRHDVMYRDDSANLERMYYRALSHTAQKQSKKRLRLYPDANSMLDWAEIRAYMNATRVSKSKPYIISLFEEDRSRFIIEAIEEQDSQREPLVQLADLFCGMGRCSLESLPKVLNWLHRTSITESQMLLLPLDRDVQPLSRGEDAKFRLIKLAKEEAQKYKLGLSLETKGFLNTPDPRRSSMNFWLYVPQHDQDKAPVRVFG